MGISNKGILLIVSGFAGSGKGTIMKQLTSMYDNYALSISATTRAPRKGEEDGREYFFKTREEFESMIAADELLEHAQYVGNYYGTPKEYVEKMLAQGKDVILEIEIQGALLVKEKRPDALLIFVMPPSVEEVYNRLKKRGTEDEEVIMKRMRRGSQEVLDIDKYDYLLINDDLDECVGRLHSIVQGCKNQMSRNEEFINDVKRQFDDFLK